MKYFLLQCKRLLKTLPFVIIVATVLLAILLAVFSEFSKVVKQEQESRFKIGVVGETTGRFFNLGITALKTLDTSRFSIDIELTDTETAKKQLLAGEISAYVVIPKNFVKAAQYGKILPISYYTTASTVDISAIMRDEITDVIASFLKESQKGVFGTEIMLNENGYQSISLEETNEINIQYIDFIIDRTKMYKTYIIGVSGGLDIVTYLLIGLSVVLVCVSVIPLACRFVRRDNATLKMFRSAGRCSFYTVICEYGALLCVFTVCFAVLSGLCIAARQFSDLAQNISSNIELTDYLFSMFPALILISAIAFAVFELFGNIISAVTGYFFTSMALCYISGCMYPLYALPKALRNAAAFTPTGALRIYLTDVVTGDSTEVSFFVIFTYTVLFLLLAVIIRRIKLNRGEG